MELSFGVLFLEGLLSFFTPCVLPLIPAYLGMLSGATAQEIEAGHIKLRLFMRTMCFVLGFTVVFVALGATATLLGNFLLRNIRAFRIVGGVLIILFGIATLEILPLPFLQREHRFRANATGYAGAFLLGMAFSFGWTPCIGPILSGVLMMLGTSGASLPQGMALLATYSFGLGLPFLLISLFARVLLPKVRKLGKYTLLIKRVSGVILIVMGILVLTNSLAIFAQL